MYIINAHEANNTHNKLKNHPYKNNPNIPKKTEIYIDKL